MFAQVLQVSQGQDFTLRVLTDLTVRYNKEDFSESLCRGVPNGEGKEGVY